MSSENLAPETNGEKRAEAEGSETLIRDLLPHHAEQVQQARSRMEINRKKKFYFLTIPGITRIVQCLFAVLHISAFGYYCTHNDEVKNMLPPYCLTQTREQFFMLCNYHTLLGCITIVLAGIFSPFSNAAMLSSLYPLLFDIIQASSIFISAIFLMHFHKANSDKISEVMPEGSSFKSGLALSGFALGCTHVVSAVYDLLVFIQHLRAFRAEQKALEDEERTLTNPAEIN